MRKLIVYLAALSLTPAKTKSALRFGAADAALGGLLLMVARAARYAGKEAHSLHERCDVLFPDLPKVL
jgi:hypothetical protein